MIVGSVARQVHEVAAVQRQRLDLLVADRRPQLGGRGLQQRGLADDGHGLGGGARFELQLDLHVLSDPELDVRDRERSEAGLLGRDGVVPRR
jgi:hypothetical protein